MVDTKNNLTELNTFDFLILGIIFFVLSTAPIVYGDLRHVSGEVMGVWGSGDNSIDTIIVDNDINVPADRSLRIVPNVYVLFSGNHFFQIEGSLSAVNGVQDNQMIVFAGLQGRSWRGIWFRAENQRNSIIEDCAISNAWVGIDIDGSSPAIFDNTIHALSVGINCEDSRSNISGNIIIVGEATSSPNLTGISLRNESNAFILENRIEVRSNLFGELIGINIIESNAQIQDNFIEVETIGAGYGIFAVNVTKLNVIRNIVRTRSQNRMTGAYFRNSTGTMLLNNTLHLIGSSITSRGAKIDQGSRVLILSNIFLGNNSSYGIESVENSVLQSSGYNDLWNHSRNFEGNWRGSQTDISEDPLILNATADADTSADYILTWVIDENRVEHRSPCIDTGSPQFIDPDTSRSDMGAVPFDHGVGPIVIVDQLIENNNIPMTFKLLEVYPNPFNASTRIRFSVSYPKVVAIEVFNYQGRSVTQLWKGALERGVHSFSWSPKNVASGLYFIKLQSENVSKTVSLNYLR